MPLRYKLVLSSENPTLVRYVAQEQKEDGNFQNITVLRWLTYMTADLNQGVTVQFSNLLQQHAIEMKAFFFETKGVTFQAAQTKDFEFILMESDYLFQFADSKQDDSDFRDLLQCGEDTVGCVFPNLGGDSTLISPTPRPGMADNTYGHLAAFLQRAPQQEQVIPFWKLTFQTVMAKLEKQKDNPNPNDNTPIWLSTEGTSVKWLHMRIDPRPKYYKYRPFANKK